MSDRTSTAPTSLTRIALMCGGVLALLVLVQGAPQLIPDSNDDAFISFRYAQNVLQGEGAVFNPGERVEGYSSPLWLGLLVLLSALVGVQKMPHAAQLASTAATLLCVSWLAFWLRKMQVRPVAILVAVGLLCLAPTQLVWSRSGMETTMASLLLATAATGSLDPTTKWRLAAALVCSGLICWVRPEGPAWAAAIVAAAALGNRGAWTAPGRRRLLVVQIAVVVFSTTALLSLRRVYYGQWLPNTYYAKISCDADVLWRGVGYVTAFFRSHGGAPLIALAALAAVTGRHRRVAGQLIAVAAVSALIVAAEGGDFMWHGRFMQPSWPIWAALAALGVDAALDSSVGLIKPPWRTLAVTVVAIWLVWGATRDLFTGELGGAANEAVHKHRMARSTGQTLRRVLLPGEAIVVGPAGQFVWESRAPRAYDTWGLVVPEVARSARVPGGRAGHERANLHALLARNPDFFIVTQAWELTPPCERADARGIPHQLPREFAGLDGNGAYQWVYVRHPARPYFFSFLARDRAFARARPFPVQPITAWCRRR